MKKIATSLIVLILSVFGLNSLADQVDSTVQKSIQLAQNGESGGGNGMGGPKRTRS